MKKTFFSLSIALFSIGMNAQISINHDDAKKIAIEHNNYLNQLVNINPQNQEQVILILKI